MKISDNIIHKLSLVDIKVLNAINDKKEQTALDLVRRKVTGTTQVYRSIEKLIHLGVLTEIKIDGQRAKELVSKIRIDFKITQVNNR